MARTIPYNVIKWKIVLAIVLRNAFDFYLFDIYLDYHKHFSYGNSSLWKYFLKCICDRKFLNSNLKTLIVFFYLHFNSNFKPVGSNVH